LNDVTSLVCLHAHREAEHHLKETRARCSEAAYRLAAIRDAVTEALEPTNEQQSFSSLSDLFDEGKIALMIYRQAGIKFSQAEGRWFALITALASEGAMMLVRSLPKHPPLIHGRGSIVMQLVRPVTKFQEETIFKPQTNEVHDCWRQ
jgi:hypothetical protein